MRDLSNNPRRAGRIYAPERSLTVAAHLRGSVQGTLHMVQWYLHQGADRLVLYFDNPQDAAIPLLADMPRITCVPCTPAFWKKQGAPLTLSLAERRDLVLERAYEGVADGWFLGVEADELALLDGRTLAEEAFAQPGDIRAFRLPSAERLETPGLTDTVHFRIAMPRPVQAAVYGALACVMYPRAGMMSPVTGRTVLRAGLDARPRADHWLDRTAGGVICDRLVTPQEGGFILQYLPEGYESWLGKLPLWMSAPSFRDPIREVLMPILEGPTPETDLRALFAEAYVFDEARLAALDQGDARFEMDAGYANVAFDGSEGWAAWAA